MFEEPGASPVLGCTESEARHAPASMCATYIDAGACVLAANSCTVPVPVQCDASKRGSLCVPVLRWLTGPDSGRYKMTQLPRSLLADEPPRFRCTHSRILPTGL